MNRDIGVFGPDSVSWKVFGEPIVALGGLRSLYLQALHPRAVAGVAQNSSYRTDPWRRLIRTWIYLRTLLYGTTAEAQAAASRVRRLHAGMRATDPRTGEVFRIDEPDLLRWVHVAEAESFVTTVRRAGLRLTGAEVDRYYTEQRRSAELIGLDPASVPGTAADVAAYYEAVRPQLSLTTEAADIAAFLATCPPVPTEWNRPALRRALASAPSRGLYRVLAATAAGLLPPWARRLYGGRDGAATDVVAGLSARGTRLLVRVALPPKYRVPPMRRAALERAGRS
ncbi:oxygenase MpaB family protein [Nonomuraea purpurea]|uniref:Oxygenase MpaB family protein n=1 Tax=Nonomuraea purpurea TaxID=1849276 RepID=A0ABV8G7J6_9ACTN